MARDLQAGPFMEARDAIADSVHRYLEDLDGRPATILDLLEDLDDPWLRPESAVDVLAAVENLCARGLLEEHRPAGGRSFYRLPDDPTAHAPSSSGGEDA